VQLFVPNGQALWRLVMKAVCADEVSATAAFGSSAAQSL